MKKRFIICIFGYCLVWGAAMAQEPTQQDSTISQPDSVKTRYTCLLIIEVLNGVIFEAALDRFTEDSVFVAPLEEKHVKAGGHRIKILKDEAIRGIGVNWIRSINIKYDPHIIYPDELNERKDSLKRGNFARISVMVITGLITLPNMFVGELPEVIDPSKYDFSMKSRKASVSGHSLYVTNRDKVFIIEGDTKQYIKMLKRLTRSKTNPFEKNNDR